MKKSCPKWYTHMSTVDITITDAIGGENENII